MAQALTEPTPLTSTVHLCPADDVQEYGHNPQPTAAGSHLQGAWNTEHSLPEAQPEEVRRRQSPPR